MRIDQSRYIATILHNAANNHQPARVPGPPGSGIDKPDFEKLLEDVATLPVDGLGIGHMVDVMSLTLQASPAQRVHISAASSFNIPQNAAQIEISSHNGIVQRKMIKDICNPCQAFRVDNPIVVTSLAQQGAFQAITNLPLYLQNSVVNPKAMSIAWDILGDVFADDAIYIARQFRHSFLFGDIAHLLPALDAAAVTQLQQMFGLEPALSAVDRLFRADKASALERAQFLIEKGIKLPPSFLNYFSYCIADFIEAYTRSKHALHICEGKLMTEIISFALMDKTVEEMLQIRSLLTSNNEAVDTWTVSTFLIPDSDVSDEFIRGTLQYIDIAVNSFDHDDFDG